MKKGLKRHKCARTEKGGGNDGIKKMWTPFGAPFRRKRDGGIGRDSWASCVCRRDSLRSRQVHDRCQGFDRWGQDQAGEDSGRGHRQGAVRCRAPTVLCLHACLPACVCACAEVTTVVCPAGTWRAGEAGSFYGHEAPDPWIWGTAKSWEKCHSKISVSKSERGTAENQELCATSMLSVQKRREFIQEKLGGPRDKATTPLF